MFYKHCDKLHTKPDCDNELKLLWHAAKLQKMLSHRSWNDSIISVIYSISVTECKSRDLIRWKINEKEHSMLKKKNIHEKNVFKVKF